MDYNTHQPAWAQEHQTTALSNGTDFQSTSAYGQRIKINELSQSTAFLNAARPETAFLQPQTSACLEVDQSRYYPLPTSFFPPPNEQQFGPLDVMPTNNFNFLSEVTQTLLNNQCQ